MGVDSVIYETLGHMRRGILAKDLIAPEPPRIETFPGLVKSHCDQEQDRTAEGRMSKASLFEKKNR